MSRLLTPEPLAYTLVPVGVGECVNTIICFNCRGTYKWRTAVGGDWDSDDPPGTGWRRRSHKYVHRDNDGVEHIYHRGYWLCPDCGRWAPRAALICEPHGGSGDAFLS